MTNGSQPIWSLRSGPTHLPKSVHDLSRLDRLDDPHLADEEAGGQHPEDQDEEADHPRGHQDHPDVLEAVPLPETVQTSAKHFFLCWDKLLIGEQMLTFLVNFIVEAYNIIRIRSFILRISGVRGDRTRDATITAPYIKQQSQFQGTAP